MRRETIMTKSETAALEDLKDWGVDLHGDYEARHGERTVANLIAHGYLQVLESPIGEVVALAPNGYRHFAYKHLWHKPNETAMMDYLAMRLTVQTMLARGYTQATPRSRTVARVVSPHGVPTYVIVKFRFPPARVVTQTIRDLVADGIEDNAEIVIFREDPHRIKGALQVTHHRVIAETPPWMTWRRIT
jgi:hypothetical protein